MADRHQRPPTQQPRPQSPEAPNVDTREIDRVLRLRRKQHQARSCVPCKRRKVACDNAQPCATCRKRDHPQICIYETRTRLPTRDQQPSGSPSAQGLASAESLSSTREPEPIESQGNDPVQSPQLCRQRSRGDEDDSIAAIVQGQARETGGDMLAQNVSHVLGMQNTLISYPFMDFNSPSERWSGLLKVLPHRHEVLAYLPVFQTRVAPFTPLVVDADQTGVDAHQYLQAYAAGDLHPAAAVSAEWSRPENVGLVSLLLAILSSGAHFSDVEGGERSRICYDLARRSFEALRLANFLFRPTLQTVQAMLVLGHTLQNTGQSDAAWALLGTTARLAQTLSFHSANSRALLPVALRAKAESCWSNIVWQDTLLSICHARSSLMFESPQLQQSEESDLGYRDVMHGICELSQTFLKQDNWNIMETSGALAKIDGLRCRAQKHLQSSTEFRTDLEHLQSLALRLHISLVVTYVCRPVIKNIPSTATPTHDLLRQRAEQNLMEATRAFLEFHAVSSIPLRSWCLVHTVLSSVLLLCIWRRTRTKPECRDLRERVIQAFMGSGMPDGHGKEGPDNPPSNQWLSQRHAYALLTLKEAFTSNYDAAQRSEDTVGGEDHAFWRPRSGSTSFCEAVDPAAAFADVSQQDFSFNILGGLTTTELSPFNDLDAIMGGPIW